MSKSAAHVKKLLQGPLFWGEEIMTRKGNVIKVKQSYVAAYLTIWFTHA